MTLALLLLSGLATWRLASLLHTEDMFEWFREGIGIGHDEDRHPIMYPETLLGRIFRCFWCLTLVVSVFISVTIALAAGLSIYWALPLWLASSAFAIYWEKQIMRTQSR